MPDWALAAGMAQLIEFLAPPAIAAAIGAYFHIFLPQVPVTVIAIAAYLFFTALNVWGVKATAAAIFELAVTMLAAQESAVVLRRHLTRIFFSWAHFRHNSFLTDGRRV